MSVWIKTALFLHFSFLIDVTIEIVEVKLDGKLHSCIVFLCKIDSTLAHAHLRTPSSQTPTHFSCCSPAFPCQQIRFNSLSVQKPCLLDFNHPPAAQFPLTPRGQGCHPEAAASLYQPLSNTNVNLQQVIPFNSTRLCRLISMRKANTGNQARSGFGAKGDTSFSTTKTGFAPRIKALSPGTKSYSEGGAFLFFFFLLLSVK